MILAHDKARLFQQRGRCKSLNSQHWLSISHYLANHCFLFNHLWFTILRQYEKLKKKLSQQISGNPQVSVLLYSDPQHDIFTNKCQELIQTPEFGKSPWLGSWLISKHFFPYGRLWKIWGGGSRGGAWFFSNLDFFVKTLRAGDLVFVCIYKLNICFRNKLLLNSPNIIDHLSLGICF